MRGNRPNKVVFANSKVATNLYFNAFTLIIKRDRFVIIKPDDSFDFLVPCCQIMLALELALPERGSKHIVIGVTKKGIYEFQSRP